MNLYGQQKKASLPSNYKHIPIENILCPKYPPSQLRCQPFVLEPRLAPMHAELVTNGASDTAVPQNQGILGANQVIYLSEHKGLGSLQPDLVFHVIEQRQPCGLKYSLLATMGEAKLGQSDMLTIRHTRDIQLKNRQFPI